MTICIAGICEHRGKSAIVMCADWQGTREGFTKSSDTYKMRIAGNATILISGSVGHADEMVSRLSPILVKFHSLDKDKDGFDDRIVWLLDELRRVIRKYRDDMLAHAIAIKYGFSLDWYNNGGGIKLRPERAAAVQMDIVRLSIEELLIAYVEDEEPILLKVTEDGDVIQCDNYDCVGSGGSIALSILCQEDWGDRMPLMDCAARIYTAKVAAHKNPEVGISTSFDIRVKGEGSQDFTDEGFRYLKRQIRRIKFPSGLALKSTFLQTIPEN